MKFPEVSPYVLVPRGSADHCRPRPGRKGSSIVVGDEMKEGVGRLGSVYVTLFGILMKIGLLCTGLTHNFIENISWNGIA